MESKGSKIAGDTYIVERKFLCRISVEELISRILKDHMKEHNMKGKEAE